MRFLVGLKEPDTRWRPSMLARVEFLAASTTKDLPDTGGLAVYVPSGAIQGEVGAAWVWVVMDDGRRCDRRTVTLGGRRESWVEVRNGVLPGQIILVAAPGDLRPGQRIRLVQEQP